MKSKKPQNWQLLRHGGGVKSTYFVLLTSDFYNVFSGTSKKGLEKIRSLGHEIGLHFDEMQYENGNGDLDFICEKIQWEAKLLGEAAGCPVQTVSMHRPSKRTLDSDFLIPGLINSYGSIYLKEFKYLSDSRRRWREPVEEIIESEQYERLHILTHAFWYREEESTRKETVSCFVNGANWSRYQSYRENFTDLPSVMTPDEVLGIIASFRFKGVEAVAKQIGLSCSYVRGRRKKCLVVDLDNTLWGGVIGKDGVDGIILDRHKEGGRYYDMQKCLKRMKENGIMLAMISKNNPEDVMPVFAHPCMVLKETDFVSQKINWRPKTENIREMARELNIGLDAFVFLDDNPAEREQMREQCPEVEVVEFPKDTCLLSKVVEDAYDQYFKSLFITREDQNKTEKYRLQSKRREMEEQCSSVEDYLKKLELMADIHLMRKEEKNRVIQLAGKTNQFNTTTIRYDERQLEEIEKSGIGEIVVAQMKDRFGDEGLIAVIVMIYEGETGKIQSSVMSCRVMGRQLEYVMMDEIVKWIRLSHPEILRLEAEYRKTGKNKPVEELYDQLGFQVKEIWGEEEEMGFRKLYQVELESLSPFIHSYKKVFAFQKY